MLGPPSPSLGSPGFIFEEDISPFGPSTTLYSQPHGLLQSLLQVSLCSSRSNGPELRFPGGAMIMRQWAVKETFAS